MVSTCTKGLGRAEDMHQLDLDVRIGAELPGDLLESIFQVGMGNEHADLDHNSEFLRFRCRPFFLIACIKRQVMY